MSSRSGSALEGLAVLVYGVVDWLVIMAPSLALLLAAERGGLGDREGLDLVLVSAVVATPHAVVAARRLRFEERTAVRHTDIWIASVDAVVVLALATTLLTLVVLETFADEHAALAERGYPVVALWAGVQLAAVAVSEAVGRGVFWWLEPNRPDLPPGGVDDPAEGEISVPRRAALRRRGRGML